MPRKRVSGTRSSAQRVHLEVSRSAAAPAQLALGLEAEPFDARLMANAQSAWRRPSWQEGPEAQNSAADRRNQTPDLAAETASGGEGDCRLGRSVIELDIS